MNTIESTSREDWLNKAANLICAEIISPAQSGAKPPFRLSVAPMKAKHAGECYPRSRSEDQHNEIFITAHCDDSLEILDTLTHELLHAYDDCQSKHKGFFAYTANKIGMIGKQQKKNGDWLGMTIAHAGPELLKRLSEYVELLGPIPHARISQVNKDKGRNGNKIVCNDCGFQANLSRKWAIQTITNFECPVCAGHNTQTELK